MKNFQVILLVIFGIFGALAAAIFSGGIKLPQKASETKFGAVGTVTIWGTFPSSGMESVIESFNKEANDEIVVFYQQKDEKTFSDEFLKSLAFGGSPDILIIPQSLVNQYDGKFTVIPYTAFTKRMFTDTYVDAANIFTKENGILGFPIVADPIVMYYNKDSFNSAGIVEVPKYWREILGVTPDLTDLSSALEVRKSAVAMGEFSNVRNAKKIMSALILQLGNNIVSKNESGKEISILAERSYISSNPVETVMRFYTEFSNPLSSLYSWNKSMPNSLDAFVAGDLAIYFGPASEFALIRSKNPNLNFNVSDIPQVEGSSATTYADIYSMVIPSAAKNPSAASVVASTFANGTYARQISDVTGFTPVRRDILRAPSPLIPEQGIFYKASLQSKTWADPNSEETDKVFSGLVENILSGLKNIDDAVESASKELQIVIDTK